MEIGPPKRVWQVEPLRDPFEQPEPVKAPEKQPVKTPEPVRSPEKVPA